ncbi:DUF1634 domain-containing protein [Dyadobacter sp. 3J3]|uniref:DUF1634 domain-containing protein n=1 Tax=Dyadobacter sp. 3J3 TaxID=2606600 RepID=UPI0013567CDC|nr:DUF1634 domain-containing protein [Dyadobacter sp. 3J3]
MKSPNTDRLQRLTSLTLRSGVIMSLFFMMIGGIAFLTKHSGDVSEFSTFTAHRISVPDIFWAAIKLQSKALINVGIIILITTPVMRVLLSFFIFALQRDRLYAVITLLVMAIILISIASGHTS